VCKRERERTTTTNNIYLAGNQKDINPSELVPEDSYRICKTDIVAEMNCRSYYTNRQLSGIARNIQ